MCQIEKNPCDEFPCYNGGACSKLSVTDFVCVCHPDFEGELCEIEREVESTKVFVIPTAAVIPRSATTISTSTTVILTEDQDEEDEADTNPEPEPENPQDIIIPFIDINLTEIFNHIDDLEYLLEKLQEPKMIGFCTGLLVIILILCRIICCSKKSGNQNQAGNLATVEPVNFIDM